MGDPILFLMAYIGLTVVLFVVANKYPQIKKRFRVLNKKYVLKMMKDSERCRMGAFIPVGQVMVVTMVSKKTDEPIGHAIVVIDEDICELWHIFIRSQLRYRGYGKELIRALQGRYDTIVTQFDRRTINEDGNRLCLSLGFVPEAPMFKRQQGVGKLIWRRRDHAQGNGRGTEKGSGEEGFDRR